MRAPWGAVTLEGTSCWLERSKYSPLVGCKDKDCHWTTIVFSNEHLWQEANAHTLLHPSINRYEERKIIQKVGGSKPTHNQCSVMACAEAHHGKGLCLTHYNAARRAA